MRSQRLRSRSASRGAVALEFAMILLPFCFLLLGVLDYGWYFYLRIVCTNAAREGARTASTYPGACPNAAAMAAGTNAVSSALATLIPPSYTPTIDATCTTVSASPQFKVSLTLSFPQLTGFTLIPMPGGGFGGNATIQTAATMRGVQ